jgi:hypothetical protein
MHALSPGLMSARRLAALQALYQTRLTVITITGTAGMTGKLHAMILLLQGTGTSAERLMQRPAAAMIAARITAHATTTPPTVIAALIRQHVAMQLQSVSTIMETVKPPIPATPSEVAVLNLTAILVHGTILMRALHIAPRADALTHG